ncbi:MAG: NADPH:quinone reductase [Pararhodobacter sp.]|nr:NADPH:quinone reductase [Pararhodobacter sp.]
MRAICYRRTGAARDVLQLETLDRPEPGPGEVLVRVAVSGANPSDAKMRSGTRGPMAHPVIVPHSDGAGRIAAVGAGVDPARIGQRVWLWNAAWGRAMGTAAEFVALPASQAVPLPDAASYADGACLGIPAQTAHRAVLADGPVDGLDVLVTGGAGAVGAYAVQIARLGGARVIVTTSGGVKAAHARAMGADHLVDYRDADAAQQVLDATGGRGIDRVVEVEFGVNLPLVRAVLKDNGIIAAYGSAQMPEPVLPFSPMMFAGLTLRMVLVYKLPDAARADAIADLTAWLQGGALQHPVGLRVPLEACAAAHEAAEGNDRIGALLVDVAEGV